MSTWKTEDLNALYKLALTIIPAHKDDPRLPPKTRIIIVTGGGKNHRKELAWLLCHETIGVTDYGTIVAPLQLGARSRQAKLWRHLSKINDLEVFAYKGSLQLDTLEDALKVIATLPDLP